MPTGQAHTTWFPELKDILNDRWNSKLTIEQHFDLVNDLNIKLKQIRTDLNIQPPMMWCPNCQKRHRSRFTDISISAMYYALKRFDFCDEQEFKTLTKEWAKYSKMENIDIYRKIKMIEENTKEENK